VTIRLQPIGSAPHLRQKIFKVSSANRFETIVGFLRKRLLEGKSGEEGAGAGGGNGSVFCYVNSVFAPGLDEGVGALWRVSLHFRGGMAEGGRMWANAVAVLQD